VPFVTNDSNRVIECIMPREQRVEERRVGIPAGAAALEGSLNIPESACGIILFAHGSGSSRHSPRNQLVARMLRAGGLGTLLFDLLTQEEEDMDKVTGSLRFDIGLLAQRLVHATDWLANNQETRQLKVGYFGSSTGGGAALVAASERPDIIGAVVSRGGRPDLAATALPRVKAPTLLIVGGKDFPVIGMNQEALEQLGTIKRLEIIPGATHLFEEPAALEKVAQLAREWFEHYLPTTSRHNEAQGR
jgi:putative phosphoribosyl transferase